MKKYFKNQKGAAALIAAIVVSIAVLSMSFSLIIIVLNNRTTLNSFVQSVQGFYSAESGLGEALMQLRKTPSQLVFDGLVVGNINVASEFIEGTGASCGTIPECQFVPGTGWWEENFNYLESHPDMQVDPYPGPTPDPRDHDWYDDTYKTHEEVEGDLLFGSNYFPYDGTEWQNNEGWSHDYFFGQHWRALVTATSTADYGYHLASDDDSWVLLNGFVVVNNSGTHANFIKTGTISLAAGNNVIDIYFAERHTTASAMDFQFDDSSLVITPFPEGCGDEAECSTSIQTTASTTNATRKVRYSCNQDISDCAWDELIP